MYVVTFVVFLVLSERLEQATSKHVCKFFSNIKTVFRSSRTEQNVKSRQSPITSKLSRIKVWFLNMFLDIVFRSLSTFTGIVVIAQKTKFGYRSFVKLSFIETQ